MSAGWDGDALLETNLRTLTVTSALQAVYDEMNVRFQAGTESVASSTGSDVIVLGAGNTTQGGGEGDDAIFAGGALIVWTVGCSCVMSRRKNILARAATGGAAVKTASPCSNGESVGVPVKIYHFDRFD